MSQQASHSVGLAVHAELGGACGREALLWPLAGEPLLARTLERVRTAKLTKPLVVVTTTSSEDDPIVALCASRGVSTCRTARGGALDVLRSALRELGTSAVVSVLGDAPLIDPELIDRIAAAWLTRPRSIDAVSNQAPKTWPKGYDVELVSAAALERLGRRVTDDSDGPFLGRHATELRLENLRWDTELDYSQSHCFRVHMAEDYELVRTLFEASHAKKPNFSLCDVMALLAAHPELLGTSPSFRNGAIIAHHCAGSRDALAPTPRHQRDV